MGSPAHPLPALCISQALSPWLVWDGCTSPDQTSTIRIDYRVREQHGVLQILQGVIIEVELALQGSIG